MSGPSASGPPTSGPSTATSSWWFPLSGSSASALLGSRARSKALPSPNPDSDPESPSSPIPMPIAEPIPVPLPPPHPSPPPSPRIPSSEQHAPPLNPSARQDYSDSPPPQPPPKDSETLLASARLKMSWRDAEAMRKLRSTMPDLAEVEGTTPSPRTPVPAVLGGSRPGPSAEMPVWYTLGTPVGTSEKASLRNEPPMLAPRVTDDPDRTPRANDTGGPSMSNADFVIAVVGHDGVGKSTVIRRATKAWNSSSPLTCTIATGHQISSSVARIPPGGKLRQECKVEFVEVPLSALNLSRSGSLFPHDVPSVSGVLLCYDATRPWTLQGVSEILGQLDASGTSTVLLGCKSDPDAVLEVAAADANALCQPYDIGLIEVTIATTEGKGKMHNAVRWLLFKLEQRQRRRERQSSVDSTAETAPAQLKTKTATMKPLDSLVSPDSDASSGADRFMWYRRGPELGKSGHERGPGGHGGDGHVSDTRSSSSSLQWIMGSKPSTGNDKRDSAGGRSSLSTEGTGSAAVPAPASPSAQRPAEHILDTRLNAVRAPESLSPYTSLDGLMNQLFTAITSATNERFVRAFLLTFRRFCYTHQLMAEFLERFRQVERDSASDEERRWALMRMTGALLEWTKRYPGDLASEQTRGLFRDVVDLLLKHTFMAHLTADLVSVQGSIMDVVDLDASWSFGEKRAAPSITSTSTGLDVDRELSDDVDALDFGDKEKTPSSRTVSTASLVVGGDLQASLHDGSDKKTSLDTGSNLSASLHTDLQTSLSRGSNLSASLRGDLHPSLSRGSSLRAPASSPKSPNGSAVQLKRSNTRSRTKLGRGSAADSAASVSRFGLGDDDLGFSQWASAWAYVVQQDANDVAVNLTRMQWALFAAIRPRDVFRHDLGKEKDGPVGQSILFFNHISRWVTTMILASPKAKHRARIYERFMLIAHQLRRLNNYDCLYAITSGMSETSVHRLAQTQQLVVAQAAPALQQDFKSHMDLMEPRGGYLRYRKAIAADLAHGRSAIPLLMTILSLVNRLQAVRSDDRRPNGMIQWDKFARFADIVSVISECQDRGPMVRGDVSPTFKRLVVEPVIASEDGLYERSQMLEPPASSGTGSNLFRRFGNLGR